MLPKMGKVFPGGHNQREGTAEYAAAIAAALRKQLGTSHQGIKIAMCWTGAGERTVKNWFAGTHGPSGEHLVAPAHHSDAILEAFLVMAGRPSAVATAKLSEVRERLVETVEAIDRLMARRDACR